MTREAPRTCGILLHPTSLPGPYGIGTIGASALAFVDFLHDAGQSVWQILPLGPTGYGDSPYSARSSFAGNPLLIDLDLLAAEGLVDADDLARAPTDGPRIDFDAVQTHKSRILQRAAEAFVAKASPSRLAAFEQFSEKHGSWLDDWALFSVASRMQGDRTLHTWDEPLKRRQPEAIAGLRREHADELRDCCIIQFFFFDQWEALHRYARAKGVTLLGDMPIFVAYDSDAVWANPKLFKLDDNLVPPLVAGVPPDYFAKDGQLWGNPLYDWPAHAKTGFAWWLDRLRHGLELTDMIRLDHFRGFEAAWEVPATHKTARKGSWVKGPGDAFFEAIRARFGGLPLVAEDLGLITDDVRALRDRHGLAGMFVLHFGFTPGDVRGHAPHRCVKNSVVYTGTHDNDTSVGWYQATDEATKHLVRVYFNTDGSAIHRTLIRAAYQTVADTAIVPIQDVFGYGNEARMNVPGLVGANWSFRLTTLPNREMAKELRGLAELFERLPIPAK